MNTTPNATIAAELTTPKFNASQRTLESRIETSIPGIFLTVSTSHTNRTYWSRVDRVQIEDGILTMKIDAARFNDIAPVGGRKIAAPRYSAKNLEAAHAAFVPAVGAQLADALAWAERF